jgi:hypothetical protein
MSPDWRQYPQRDLQALTDEQQKPYREIHAGLNNNFPLSHYLLVESAALIHLSRADICVSLQMHKTVASVQSGGRVNGGDRSIGDEPEIQVPNIGRNSEIFQEIN